MSDENDVHRRRVCAALVGLLAMSQARVAQQKTAKQCNDEWIAGQAGIQASGKTRRIFVAECRGATLPRAGTPVTLAKGQFATEAEAKASCPTDVVVGSTLRSKVYHASGSKSFAARPSRAPTCARRNRPRRFPGSPRGQAPREPEQSARRPDRRRVKTADVVDAPAAEQVPPLGWCCPRSVAQSVAVGAGKDTIRGAALSSVRATACFAAGRSDKGVRKGG